MKRDTDSLEETLKRASDEVTKTDEWTEPQLFKALAEAVRRKHCVAEHSYRNCQDYGCSQPYHDKCLHCGHPKADEVKDNV